MSNENIDWTGELEPRQLQEVRLAIAYVRDFAHGTSGDLAYRTIARLADLLNQYEAEVLHLKGIG